MNYSIYITKLFQSFIHIKNKRHRRGRAPLAAIRQGSIPLGGDHKVSCKIGGNKMVNEKRIEYRELQQLKTKLALMFKSDLVQFEAFHAGGVMQMNFTFENGANIKGISSLSGKIKEQVIGDTKTHEHILVFDVIQIEQPNEDDELRFKRILEEIVNDLFGEGVEDSE